MRTTLLTGGVLVVAAVVLVMLSSSLGLDVESVALMGASSGAVIALVPHRPPQWRLVGFLVGFAASWLAYLVRAGFLPDTAAGHAIAVGLVVAMCSAAAALSRDRIPLWSTLLGAAVLAGSYETTYIEAPSQVLSTSPVDVDERASGGCVRLLRSRIGGTARPWPAGGCRGRPDDTRALDREGRGRHLARTHDERGRLMRALVTGRGLRLGVAPDRYRRGGSRSRLGLRSSHWLERCLHGEHRDGADLPRRRRKDRQLADLRAADFDRRRVVDGQEPGRHQRSAQPERLRRAGPEGRRDREALRRERRRARTAA